MGFFGCTYHIMPHLFIVHNRGLSLTNKISILLALLITFFSCCLIFAAIPSLQQLQAFLLSLWKWIHCNLMCRLFFSFFPTPNHIKKKIRIHTARTQFSYFIRLRQSVFFFKRLSLVSCYPLFEVCVCVCALLTKHLLDRLGDVVCIIERIPSHNKWNGCAHTKST